MAVVTKSNRVAWGGARVCRALVMMGVLAGACSDSSSQRLAAASLAEGCAINSDCVEPLVCAFRRCHNECETSRDCDEGQRCVASDRPFRVCLLEEERDCVRNSQCPAPMVCGVDGECRDQCTSDRDCVVEQQCASGVCAEPEELDSEGQLPVSPEAEADPDTGGEPCLYNSECDDGLVCELGSCVPECRTDVDCPRGARCEAGTPSRCVADTSAEDAGACFYNSDCSAGRFCVGGACRCQCREDVDCSLGATCDGCACSTATGGTGGAGGAGGSGGAGGVGTGGTATGGAGGTADASVGCFYNSDCSGGGEVCIDGQCRCQCREDVDCAAGEVCDGCGCVIDAPDGAPADFGTSCNLNSDCEAPLVCLNGRCTFECQVDSDCGSDPGLCCFDNRCVTGDVCSSSTDGGGGAGGTGGDAGCEPCSSNFDCADGVWCNGIERCFAGCCAPALDTPCDSNSACIEDICDEATQTCEQIVIAGEDVDGDGHLAFGCENGDDCDDSDPEVFTGAPELCDGKDNDCNGLVDDRSRRPYGESFSHSAGPGPGGGAPVSGGWGLLSRIGKCCTSHRLNAALIDDQGTVQFDWRIVSTGPNVFPQDVSGGGGTVLALFREEASSPAHYAFLVDEDMSTVIKQFPITPSMSSGLFGGSDSTWTGTDYFIGWIGDGSASTGNVATLRTDGTLIGALVPTGESTSTVQPARIKVASNASTRAALYRLPDDSIAVGVFSTALSPVAGPVILPADATQTPRVLAIGGTTGGYIAVWSDVAAGARATFVSDAGQVGETVDVPGSVPLRGDGATDGEGAMFAFDYGERASFGYVKGVFDNPFEVSSAISTGHAGTRSGVNLATDGSRFGLFLYTLTGTRIHWVPVGCPPPPDTSIGDAGTD